MTRVRESHGLSSHKRKRVHGRGGEQIRLQKRQIKRAKIVAIILGTAAIISMGFMLFAFVRR